MSTLKERLEDQTLLIRSKKLALKSKLESLGVTGLSELPTWDEMIEALDSIERDTNLYSGEHWYHWVCPAWNSTGVSGVSHKSYYRDGNTQAYTTESRDLMYGSDFMNLLNDLKDNQGRVLSLVLSVGKVNSRSPINSLIGIEGDPNDIYPIQKSLVSTADVPPNGAQYTGLSYSMEGGTYQNELYAFRNYMNIQMRSMMGFAEYFTAGGVYIFTDQDLVGYVNVSWDRAYTRRVVGKITEVVRFLDHPDYTLLKDKATAMEGRYKNWDGFSIRVKSCTGMFTRPY